MTCLTATEAARRARASVPDDEIIALAHLLKGVDLYLMAAIEFCGLAPQDTPEGATI